MGLQSQTQLSDFHSPWGSITTIERSFKPGKDCPRPGGGGGAGVQKSRRCRLPFKFKIKVCVVGGKGICAVL